MAQNRLPLVATILGFFAIAASIAGTTAWPFSRHLQDRLSVEDGLRTRIERFRRQMPCGFNGGPPLAPFNLDELDLTVSQPGSLVSTGTVRNLTVYDLDGFHIDYVTFSLFRLRLEYSFTWPIVRSTGTYNVNATIMDMFNVWGQGPFEFDAISVKVSGFVRLSISILGQLSVVEMGTEVSIDSVRSQISGLMDSEEETQLYNEFIEQLLPDLVQTNRRELSDALGAVLMPLINEQLADLTIGDLIGQSNADDGASDLCDEFRTQNV